MKHITGFLFFLFLTAGFSEAQTYDGYTLYSKMGNSKAYLLNMDKTIYHTWNCNVATGYSSYLLPGQVLLRSCQYSGNQLSGAAMCGMVQKLDWSGTVLWQYIYSTSTYCTHHDICPMPNGNVLLISYEVKTPSEVIQAGCSQNITMWPDKVVEIQPSGTNGGYVVWEWHAWDHLCQNVNPAKDNYVTSIAQHPELLNINYNTQKDWMHTNGIDYNESLDQIVISSHYLNEIYVIDHSTTTTEAAGHTGGNSGKGGDILYRWGNPAAYSCGTSANQIFKVVHDAHWIHPDCPHANDLVGFNNQGASGNQSCVDRFTPPYNGYTYTGTPGTAYTPSTYNKRINCLSSAGNQSNSQQLPNGNTLVCISTTGYMYEIDSNQNLLWSHTVGGSLAQAFRYSSCYVNGDLAVDASAAPSQVCTGSSTQLNATMTSGTATGFSWTSSPPGFTSTLQNPVVSPAVSTTYYVSAVNGTCSAIDSVQVTVSAPFSLTVTATPDTVCPGQSSQLNVTANGSGTFSYSWSSDPSGFTSTLQNPQVSPLVTTTYYVTVNNGSCAITTSVVLVVNSPFTVQSSADPGSVCYGESSQLNAVVTGSTASYTYSWTSDPPGFTSNIPNPVVSPLQSTIYTIQVSDGSCAAFSDVIVNVVGPVSVGASASPSEICAGDQVQLTATATGGITYSYSWTSSPAGFSSILQNPVVNPLVTTTYYLAVNSDPCSGSDSVVVTVNPVPPVPVITSSGDTLYSGSSVGNQWYRNTDLIPGAVNNYYVPTENGSYQVRVTSEDGCESEFSEAYIITSVDDVRATLPVVYPNPTTGVLHVSSPGRSRQCSVRIFDATGLLRLTSKNSETIDLSLLPDGMYAVMIMEGSVNVITRKVLLKR